MANVGGMLGMLMRVSGSRRPVSDHLRVAGARKVLYWGVAKNWRRRRNLDRGTQGRHCKIARSAGRAHLETRLGWSDLRYLTINVVLAPASKWPCSACQLDVPSLLPGD